MSGGLWFLNEDGSDCDDLNWFPPVGIDYTEEELDQLLGPADEDEEIRMMPADPSLPITPNMAEDPENDPVI